jgi:hypothetical protein
MQWVDLSAQQQRARHRFAVIGAVIGASVAGLLVGWSEAQSKELTPAQIIALRFPATWANAPAKQASAVTAVAKRQEQKQILFNPNPTFALASTESRQVLPGSVLAYADSAETTRMAAVASAGAETAVAPTPRPRARPKPDNHHILNDAQIASIKARLKLTPDQERYWPAVEAALRGIAYKVKKHGGRLAAIDAEGPEVQQLKSAAIPLIMMFSEQQKGEVRQLVQVMGLQKLAAQF